MGILSLQAARIGSALSDQNAPWLVFIQSSCHRLLPSVPVGFNLATESWFGLFNTVEGQTACKTLSLHVVLFL